MTITFKKYVADNKHKFPKMETVLGKHSKKPKDFPEMETVMGNHSHEKKNLKEAKEDYGKDFSHLENHYKITGDDHATAVDHYTNDSYYLNKKHFGKLPSGLVNNPNGHTHKLAAIKHMETHLPGLLKAHKTPHELIVHTGLKVSPHKYFDEGGKHAHVHMPAYTSTSMEHEIAKDFSKVEHKESHALKLHIPKDAHGAYIGHHSNHPEEHEFLIHHGAVIKIHHKPEITSDKYGVKHHTWHAELVHDGVKKLPGYPE